MRDVRHDSGLEEEPDIAVLRRAAAARDLAALAQRSFELGAEFVPLLRGVERTNADLGLVRLDPALATLVALGPRDQPLDELLVDLREHVSPLDREAGLAGVPEASDEHALDGLVEVRVGTHDDGIRSPELDRHALELGAGELHDPPARLARSGERDPAHAGMADQCLAGAAIAGH